MEYINHYLSNIIRQPVGMILFSAWLLGGPLQGQDREAYIDRFSTIAVTEMHRTGIPASIKLAQGILESNAGGSVLARQANNHFGLKCGASWKGNTMYRKDDERNRHGKLVKSCFRTFRSADESFIAHSDFLTDPRKAYRYGRLFKLSPSNYKAWAHGLKRAGYATNPRYAHLLIRIIEDYRLHEFDKITPDMLQEEKEEMLIANEDFEAPVAPPVTQSLYIHYENDVPYVIARYGDTPSKIGYEMDLPSNRVIACNEGLSDKHQQLYPGKRIYLKKKKGRYKGSRRFHLVREGETMLDISDSYAVRLDRLYKRNHMQEGAVPLPGERIYLKGRNPGSVRTTDTGTGHPAHQAMFLWDEAEKPDSGGSMESDKHAAGNKIQFVGTEPEQPDLIEYVVQPKDTLYGIARMYGTSVDVLKNLNNLGTATIRPGQVLKVQ